jgi:Flp pilus assembly pilin Flp
MNQPLNSSLSNLLKKIHQDERGAVSIETILVVAAIAIPILIFMMKVGFPYIKEHVFKKGLDDLIGETQNAHNDNWGPPTPNP